MRSSTFFLLLLGSTLLAVSESVLRRDINSTSPKGPPQRLRESNDLHLAPIRRGEVPKLKMDFSENPQEDSGKSENLILFYSFDHLTPPSVRIKDESGYDNNGLIDVGGMIIQVPGSSCKDAAYLWDQSIKVTFNTPDGAPKFGLSISLWVKMLVLEGEHYLFQAKGKRFGVMTLKFLNRTLFFSYTPCHPCTEYFNVWAVTNVTHSWAHVTATYNATTGIARVFVDGQILNSTWNKDFAPFTYWGNDVRIGGSHGQALKGYVDQIRIYNYALPSQTVEFLAMCCCFTPAGCEQTSNSLKIANYEKRSDLKKIKI